MLQLSIITVCYNAEKEIRKTVESVLNQKYVYYEYIIIDGESLDSTVSIAEGYTGKFKEKGISYMVYSEKDSGIYNAMNKGINYANGKWTIFLNAGDYLATDTVLESFNSIFFRDDVGVIYGDTIIEKNNLFRYDKSRTIDCLNKNMPFCHQSAFTLTKLLKKIKFNEKYSICADYDFFLQCYKLDEKFVYKETVVSVFSLGGMSSNIDFELQNEEELLDILYNQKLKSKKQCEYHRYKAGLIRYISECKRKFISIMPSLLKKKYDLYVQRNWKTDIGDIIR